MLVESISHTSANGDSYRVGLKGETDVLEVRMSCYLRGSLLGGFGTECDHVVNSRALPELAELMEAENILEVVNQLESATEEYWRQFHHAVMKVQSESFVWFETDWDD